MDVQPVSVDDATFALCEELRFIAHQFTRGSIEPGDIDVPAFPFVVVFNASIFDCRQKWSEWAIKLSQLIASRAIVVSCCSWTLSRSHIAAIKGEPFCFTLSVR